MLAAILSSMLATILSFMFAAIRTDGRAAFHAVFFPISYTIRAKRAESAGFAVGKGARFALTIFAHPRSALHAFVQTR